MPISLQSLLEELGYEYESHVREGANPVFESPELLTAGDTAMSGRSLLVCSLSEALNLVGRNESLCFLCIRDRIVDDSETPEAMGGILIVKRNIEIKELFNEVQRVFVKINNWMIAMQRSVMENRGMQDLISMSEPILGNHIDVMDSTFKLLAYSENITTDDPVSNALIQYGYHPEETVRHLHLHDRFAQFEKADEIIVSEDLAISKYVTVKKIFRNHESYSIVVVMLCDARPHSRGLLDLFQMLVDNMQIYVDRDYSVEVESGPAKTLLCDILDRKTASDEEIRIRAATAGLAYSSAYDLFLVSFDDTLNVPLSRLLQSLSNGIQNARVFSYARGIVILNRYEGTRVADREARLEQVQNTIGGLITAYCGVSTRFSSLRDLPVAYGQAAAAIQLGLRLRNRTEVYSDIRDFGKLYHYEDYMLHSQAMHALHNPQYGLRNTFSYRAIQSLAEHDKKHKGSMLRILHTYLQCERRATETCSRLHMHRNTVLYHVNRIEELLGVSLDDPDVRFKLQMGFIIRELESADIAESEE